MMAENVLLIISRGMLVNLCTQWLIWRSKIVGPWQAGPPEALVLLAFLYNYAKSLVAGLYHLVSCLVLRRGTTAAKVVITKKMIGHSEMG
jgi:hypothetical protein